MNTFSSHLSFAFRILACQMSLVVAGFGGPIINSFSGSAPTQGTTTITLEGSGFGASGATVTLGSATPTILGQSDTAISFTLPAGQGTGISLSVTVDGIASNTWLFAYDSPAIMEFSPLKGLAYEETEIVLTGINFGLTPEVFFNGIPGTVTLNTHTSITVTKPVDLGDYLNIMVSVGGQSGVPVIQTMVFQSLNLTSPPGYFIDLDAELVVPAPAGKFVALPNQLQPTECPAGSYTPIAGMSAAIPASLGYFVPTIGASTQTPADPGYYTDTEGATEARMASLAEYTPIAGMRAPISASPGYFVATEGADQQEPAPPGKYVPTARNTGPTPCAAGSYTPVAGMSAAIPASPGYFVPTVGASTQTPASAGYYVGTPGASEAQKATFGKYTPIAGMSAAISASPGYFVAVEGADQQEPAPPGKYVFDLGSMLPTDTPVGTFTPIPGCRAAIVAPVGTYAPTIGATSPTPIPPGYTTTGAGASEITPLPQILVTAYQLEGNGDNTISVETADGQNYGIFYTENLRDYTQIELMLGTGAVVSRTFTPPASGTARRFYVVAPIGTP